MEDTNLIRNKVNKERDFNYYTSKAKDIEEVLKHCPQGQGNYYRRMLKHYNRKKNMAEKQLNKIRGHE